MFTSRAEFRTLLRQDNADLRLTERSYRIGLASQERMNKVLAKKEEIRQIKEVLKNTSVEAAEINEFLAESNSAPISEKQKVEKIILRPNIDLEGIINAVPKIKEALHSFSEEALEQAEIQVKYQVYIDKEKELVQRMSKMEDLNIPQQFDYQKITALSAEAKEKLMRIKPQTLGQASRISGINPSDVQILMIYMGR
jgi:tRNA uridine 5-carboxymethylaminomethyl modification enzyme